MEGEVFKKQYTTKKRLLLEELNELVEKLKNIENFRVEFIQKKTVIEIKIDYYNVELNRNIYRHYRRLYKDKSRSRKNKELIEKMTIMIYYNKTKITKQNLEKINNELKEILNYKDKIIYDCIETLDKKINEFVLKEIERHNELKNTKRELKEFRELLKTKRDIEKLKSYLEKCKIFIERRDMDYYKYHKVLKEYIRELLESYREEIVITDINTDSLLVLVITSEYHEVDWLGDMEFYINNACIVDLERNEIESISYLLEDRYMYLSDLLKKLKFKELYKLI